MEAQRTLTAAGSPEGERSESKPDPSGHARAEELALHRERRGGAGQRLLYTLIANCGALLRGGLAADADQRHAGRSRRGDASEACAVDPRTAAETGQSGEGEHCG